MRTCKPWNPIHTKNNVPYTPSEIEHVVTNYSFTLGCKVRP